MTQRTRARRRRKRGGGKGRKFLIAVAAALLVVIGAAAAGASWVLSVADSAPDCTKLKPLSQPLNSAIYAGDGSFLGYVPSDTARTPVKLSKIPKRLQHATVAIEDQRFYQHGGIDYEGIARAALKDLEAGKVVQGGSTITQQLVRHLYITNPKRDLKRKIIEAQLAVCYAAHHSKREILDQYLNSASYGTTAGRTAIGVQAASKIYFNKPVWKLNLAQSALLAGLPQSPTRYNPYLNPGLARNRRNEVLQNMADQGYISDARAAAAFATSLGLHHSSEYSVKKEPFFFDYVEQKLIQKYGADTARNGGLKVYTTLDPRMQAAGVQAIDSVLYYPTDPSGAVVAINPKNGFIKAMASSGSYKQSQFNLAAQGHRQPGSSFKTFVLTDAINRGVDPYTTYYNSHHLELDLPRWGHWSVSTAENSYAGTISLEQATLLSDNTVFAQLDLDMGPKSVTEMAHRMGITSHLDSIPAEGIGGLRIGVSPLEMSDAYATLASGGIRHNPVAIRKVTFPGGHDDHPEKIDAKRVLSPVVAYEVYRILHQNMLAGTAVPAYTGCEGQAAKTGTTDNFTDAWMVGFQQNLSTAVWVGYPTRTTSMSDVHGGPVFGATLPGPIFHNFFVDAGVPCVSYPKPTQKINWAPFYGSYGTSAPHHGSSSGSGSSSSTGGSTGSSTGGSTGGYNPEFYAPGAGQAPAPSPPGNGSGN
jgi:penicillin-binding protein 1A